jgi:hypothetical protein
MTSFPPIFSQQPPYRIMTCDGGGIYGLFTTLMLRQMCENNKNFLTPGQITMFAGTSAGALITLLLAKYENPREPLLSGEAESIFWNEYTYSNKLDPMQRVLSLYGLTAWSGRADFNHMLDQYFGDMTLGELKHRVLITTFDYSAHRAESNRTSWGPRVFCNFPDDEADRGLSVKYVAYAAASPATLRPIVDGYSDGGIFADDPAINAIAKVVQKGQHQLRLEQALEQVLAALMELADTMRGLLEQLLSGDAAGRDDAALRKTIQRTAVDKAIPALRHLAEIETPGPDELDELDDFIAVLQQTAGLDGAGDRDTLEILLQTLMQQLSFIKSMHRHSATLTPPPEIAARHRRIEEYIAHLDNHLDYLKNHYRNSSRISKGILLGLRLFFAHANDIHADLIPHQSASLRHLQVLSLGVGSDKIGYFSPNINLGIAPFNILPTNPGQMSYYPPLMNLLLDPVDEAASFQAGQLLGAGQYHRLDPHVIGFPVPPVLYAAYLARIDFWRRFMAREITRQAKTEATRRVVQQALDWLDENRWAVAA